MRVAIAGAGNVGRSIARELIANGHHVMLIDKDPKAMKLDTVAEAEWVMADACEIASLDNAKLDQCQVLVAATGDDKVNLVASLLAKTEYGVPRVVARINHPKNEWLFDKSWGVDVAVSTPRIIAALVEEAVSVGDVVKLLALVKVLQTCLNLHCQMDRIASAKPLKKLLCQITHLWRQSFAMAEYLIQRHMMYLQRAMN